MFLGEFNYAIDAKGRLNFPARYRDEIGEKFIVTRWTDHSLAAFPVAEFEKMTDSLCQEKAIKTRDLRHFLFTAATEVEPDKQGRILIPNNLREYAGLEKDVTIIGNRNYAEIWNTAAWNARVTELDSDEIAKAMENWQY